MVLVVDDNQDIVRVLLILLRGDGYEAAGVRSGTEALAFLESRPVHCVILDQNMPGKTGLEVLAVIRANPRYDDVRVILFSSEDGELVDRAMAAGADAYIRKDSLDWAKMRPVLQRCCEPARTPSPGRMDPDLRDVG